MECSAKKSCADDEDDEQGQKDVGRIGVDMPNMHHSDAGCELAQHRDRRLQDETIDDVDFRMLTLDCGSEMLSDGLRAFLTGRWTEHGIEHDANRVGESSCGISY